MAHRPIWRGHLRLALVSCPVALYNARHDRETIRFNMLNPLTGSRIKMVSQDAQTGEEVARRNTVNGYEFAKAQYVIITDEDLESVRVESSGLMRVEKFVDATSMIRFTTTPATISRQTERDPKTSIRSFVRRSSALAG